MTNVLVTKRELTAIRKALTLAKPSLVQSFGENYSNQLISEGMRYLLSLGLDGYFHSPGTVLNKKMAVTLSEASIIPMGYIVSEFDVNKGGSSVKCPVDDSFKFGSEQLMKSISALHDVDRLTINDLEVLDGNDYLVVYSSIVVGIFALACLSSSKDNSIVRYFNNPEKHYKFMKDKEAIVLELALVDTSDFVSPIIGQLHTRMVYQLVFTNNTVSVISGSSPSRKIDIEQFRKEEEKDVNAIGYIINRGPLR